jgi:3,4-dihydroxy 2-butanone 4-phosphate synthase/GTP cyclohydrolase II
MATDVHSTRTTVTGQEGRSRRGHTGTDRTHARADETPVLRGLVPTAFEFAFGLHDDPHPTPSLKLASVPDAIADVAAGEMIIVIDDEDRENEGDLYVAAELVTAQHIAFMARHASGLICTAMTGERLDELGLGPLVAHNTNEQGTAFTVPVEAKHLTTTGISARDRALTARHLVDPRARPTDFVKPGHTFPLRAAEGGVLKREGHTEAAVDLARLAGLHPAGVICEIMNDDGTMARRSDLASFAERHGLRAITVAQLAAYRRATERLVARRACCELPLGGSSWKAHVYEDLTTDDAHLALVLGDVSGDGPVLARAHSACLTGDIFGSQRCDCGDQLAEAMMRIEREGSGVLLYFGSHEGRGIGLINKLKSYELQERGLDTVQANQALHQPIDSRDYSAGAAILYELGVRDIRLLTNNPAKIAGLECHGIRVVERVPLRLQPNEHNAGYLRAKREKLGHML